VTKRLLSLAAGVMIEIPPADVVSAAAAAGWPACGIWFDPEVWTDAGEREIKRRLDDTGVIALDVEPIIVGPGPDPTERIVQAAATLGARFILFTSRVDDWSLTVERYARACDLALAADPTITVVFEFLPIFPIGTLPEAKRILDEVARPNSGILIDNLHLRTSGLTPADVAAYDRSLFPYIQIADAPLEAPDGFAARLDEAINGRLWPPDGALPVDELMAVVPDVAISYEVRSKQTRDDYPDPVERATYGWNKVKHYAG